MRLPFCPYEEKVAGLVTEGNWPWAADSGMLDHVRKCSRCSETLSAVQLLQQDRSAAMLSAHAGSYYELWWKAQMRRRSTSAERITQPLLWAERFALFGILCVAGGFLFVQRGQIVEWLHWLAGIFAPHGNLLGYSILAGLVAVACICGFTLLTSEE